MAKHRTESLTRREREIMNAVFALGNRASADDVRTRLTSPPGDSSVRVMLARLEKKGDLKHRQDGSRYIYSATIAPPPSDGAWTVPADLLRRLAAAIDRFPGRGVEHRRPDRAHGGNRSCEAGKGEVMRPAVAAIVLAGGVPAFTGRQSDCRRGTSLLAGPADAPAVRPCDALSRHSPCRWRAHRIDGHPIVPLVEVQDLASGRANADAPALRSRAAISTTSQRA